MFKKFFVLLACLVGMSASAAAVPITTSVGTFTLSQRVGSYEDNLALIQSQPFWGADFELALEFYSAGVDLLSPSPTNSAIFSPEEEVSPLFLVCDNTCFFDTTFPIQGLFKNYTTGAGFFGAVFPEDTIAFVVATEVPVPAPLALLGLGLIGLGMARRRKVA